MNISIHALREEGDYSKAFTLRSFRKFLSTPSARRATRLWPSQYRGLTDFYPRPPRGGRRHLARPERHDLRISIHALREEGDLSSA